MVWEVDEDRQGFTPWILVDRDEAALTLSPLLKERRDLQPAQVKAGDEITIRFWRDGDTEYTFDARLIRHGADNALLLQHSGKVQRLQQRDFVRVNVQFPIMLYELEEAAAPTEGGPAGQEQAAVAMLDNEDGNDEGSFSSSEAADGDGWEALNTADADDAEDPSSENKGLELDKARQIHGQAVNISAGGLGVLLSESLPRASRWLVDPDFRGSFPLAAIVCVVVGEKKGGGASTVVKLKFEELTAAAEKEIVRQVYQHQILEVGGVGAHALPRPPRLADPPQGDPPSGDRPQEEED